jgi:hypothetical protein
MKTFLLAAASLTASLSYGQTDTATNVTDTLRVGSMTIIRKKGNDRDSAWRHFSQWDRKYHKRRSTETSYLILDLGFSNFSDQTNYGSAETQAYARATRTGEKGFAENDFNLRNGKSVNFSLWFVMQRRNLIKRVVNLKYGLGIECNNYRFQNNISFRDQPQPYVFRDSIAFSKNKLALDYITVPLMLNFILNPKDDSPISLSAGVSAGYLYSSRNKQISDQRGKQKNRGNYDIEKFKFSYIAEAGLGPVKLFGSYSPKSVFERGLDMRPFNIGFRIGGWD